nr:erythromycin esterase family protein [Paenibacillus taiwanensis]
MQNKQVEPILVTQPDKLSVVESIQSQAIELKTIDPMQPYDDVMPLKDMIGNATYVGLGEASHGSSEIFTMKFRLVKFLVTEMGYTNFGIEEDWGNGLKLNEYIHTGKGDPRQFLKLLYPNDEMVAMVEWMKDYNADPAHKQKIQFIGLDLKSFEPAVFQKVIDYVKLHHPEIRSEVEESYRELTGAAVSLSEYMKLTPEKKKTFNANAAKVVTLLENKTEQMNNGNTAKELVWVKGTAKVIENFTAMMIPSDYAQLVTLHDQYLADHAQWAQQTLGGKTMVWGHNIHVAKGVIDTEMYPKVAGQFLKERFGDQYVAIGTTTTKGKFTAFSDGKLATDTIQQNVSSSNYKLGEVPYEMFMLDVRKLTNQAKEWAQKKQPFFDGIAQIIPDRTQYYDAALSEQFDILLHIRETNPSQFSQTK